MSDQITLLRKLTVYNTSAQNNRELHTSAMTWGELQSELERAGIPYSGMRAVIGETQTELITPNSSLGTGDMTLFLMPRRVKSGLDISDFVDPINGVSFSDYDWEDDDPEDYTFRSAYDAGMAFLARAHALNNRVNRCTEKSVFLLSIIDVVLPAQGAQVDDDDEFDFEPTYDDTEEEANTSEGSQVDNDWGFELSRPLDPETERLKQEAELLQRLMGN